MKRFHVHVAVPDLEQSIRFYSTLFGAEPAVVKPDYAKWMLEDPRVNFAISHRGGAVGINHLGLQVDEPAELTEIHARLQAADTGVVEESNVACCYSKSDKYWVTDPSGVAWESFRSLGTVPFYNGEPAENRQDACCAPTQVLADNRGCCEQARALEDKATCCS
jgi:catechol 2,3-dioxygenase-like lactoylglutathione lyase family enzyme